MGNTILSHSQVSQTWNVDKDARWYVGKHVEGEVPEEVHACIVVDISLHITLNECKRKTPKNGLYVPHSLGVDIVYAWSLPCMRKDS